MSSEHYRNNVLLFGQFRLHPAEGLLLDRETPVRLGSRALEILIALAERPGQLVSKRDLMQIVWPDTAVLEANLTVHIAALRQALGDGRENQRYILTVPNRGYRFVAEVTTPVSAVAAPKPNNLPARLTGLIGRDEVVVEILHAVSRHRLVTIAGPGGIGKTAAALKVAEERLAQQPEPVWLVDLAAIADPALVATALASVLRLEIRSDDALPGLVAALRNKPALLVLDNCEHLIEAVATLTVAILRSAAHSRILATSREPLRVEGEQVVRLQPLASPPSGTPASAEQALAYPAVQLLTERAAAATNRFVLSDSDAEAAGEICRQLDGIPLAIEFAAARIEAFGIGGLAARLDDRMQLGGGSRRAGDSRHQTMEAALDWSFRLLDARQQVTLRRLGIFAGGFTLVAARAVIGEHAPAIGDEADLISELVAKSLIVADPRGAEPRFRLLESIRAYALARLVESGETAAIERLHAQFYLELMERAAATAKDPAAWPLSLGVEIDNIRVAMRWAFSPPGDVALGIALAAASVPVWLGHALMVECRDWMEKAVAGLDYHKLDTRRQMAVQGALVSSLIFTRGMTSEIYVTWSRAVELADDMRDAAYQHHLRLILYSHQIRLPDFPDALALAERCEELAVQIGDPNVAAVSAWMVGLAQHHSGRLAGALVDLERALRLEGGRRPMAAYGYDLRVDALGVLSNTLWLQGFPDRARLVCAQSVAAARAQEFALPLGVALTWSGFHSFLAGADIDSVEQIATELVAHAERHSLESYYGIGLCLQGACALRGGDAQAASRLLSLGLEHQRSSRYEVFRPVFGAELALAAAISGGAEAGLAVIAEALPPEHNAEHWCLPELQRVHGELLLLCDNPDAGAAEGQFRLALHGARRQGALAWELRAATSLGRMRRAPGPLREACGILALVRQIFPEAHATADLLAAEQMLDDASE